MNGELLTAIERLVREKGISKDVLFEAVESALVSAATKVIGDHGGAKEDVTVNMDKETGEITVYKEGVEVKSEKFGRIAAQTAKQVIIQKIREAERSVVFDKYQDKVGTIISGLVHRFEKGNTIIELDDAEAILPKTEQIPRERFRQGESVRALILETSKGLGAPEIILSRANEGFVKKLFELEVPEISEGIVEIRAIAREAGERTKIAVWSKDERVDAVGACVGMRGSRVKDIVRELHGERIDIVRWSDDLKEYLKAALSPAEIGGIEIEREEKTIRLIVPQDQLSLVIGKKGRNIRLASKLLGWNLNAETIVEVYEIPLADVKGISDKQKEKLEAAGLVSTDRIVDAGVEGLGQLEGIGEKTAAKIIAACEEAMEKIRLEQAGEASEEEEEGAEGAAEEAAPEGEEAKEVPEEAEEAEETEEAPGKAEGSTEETEKAPEEPEEDSAEKEATEETEEEEDHTEQSEEGEEK